MTRMFLLFTAACFMSACQASVPPENVKADLVDCPEIRPEMCTMDYVPVCGNLSDGSLKTFPNWCDACSDPDVISYRHGECE